MVNEKEIPCVIKDAEEPSSESYCSDENSFAAYSSLKEAKIFDYNKLPDYVKRNNIDYKVILLNSEDGIKLKNKIISEVSWLEKENDSIKSKIELNEKNLEKLCGLLNKFPKEEF